VPLSWLQANGGVVPASNAQLILYPQYPEVRLSSLLRGVRDSPSELMSTRLPGRLLFLGITSDRRIIAWAAGPESAAAQGFRKLGKLTRVGVFLSVPLFYGRSNRELLLSELRRIHALSWITSKALSRDGNLKACEASNCVGYTLEAEMGVPRNGKAEPDFKGWEIKAGLVTSFASQAHAKALTLMTPEPSGGFYCEQGVPAFIRKFGYADKKGRANRLNFGGTFRFGERHAGTGLTLLLNGFDAPKGLISNPTGALELVTDNGEIAALWSFAKLMSLWNRKHAQAVYVPAEMRDQPVRQYRYGARVRLCEGTDFATLLKAIAIGKVYYDPGIKLENASGPSPVTKRRSQFRIKSGNVASLYRTTTEELLT
jgi:hypothetical protein